MIETACPLDCYDACSILYDTNSHRPLKANTNHPISNGALCPLLNRYILEAPRLTYPTVDGVRVSMEEALDAVSQRLNSDTLLWRGSGNLGVISSITNLLIEKLDGTIANGSLCDGAGQAGISEGRGYNRQLPLEQIAKADVVVVWGRNITTTNSHILPYIEGKKLIVIDPISTSIAKRADMHIQIRPRSDMLLAIMMARFVIMQSHEDREWLDKHAPDYDEFYEFTQGFRIQKSLKEIDITGTMLSELVDILVGNKVVFLLGVGLQKYSIGHYTFWAIDSLASTLGLFGRDGCGVSYLGESRQGFDDPFEVSTSDTSIVDTDFSDFDSVLIQGGNPVGSMPNSNRVIRELKETKNIIYFGLYANETSDLSDIVIPAQSFLEKDDFRLSYGHHYAMDMNRATKSEYGISEYEFTKKLYDRLGFDGLKSLDEYLSKWRDQLQTLDGHSISPNYAQRPYEDGFGSSGDDDFIFIDEFYDNFEESYSTKHGEYWLLSPKSNSSLNTQFERGTKAYIPPTENLNNSDKILVKSSYGECQLVAQIDTNLRADCISIPSGTIGLNFLTPDIISQEGNSACFQEIKITIEKVD